MRIKQVQKSRYTQRGSAIVENVLLIGLLMTTFVGGLTLYTFAIKQTACEKIFIENGEFRFLPTGVGSLSWEAGAPDGPGCYRVGGWSMEVVF